MRNFPVILLSGCWLLLLPGVTFCTTLEEVLNDSDPLTTLPMQQLERALAQASPLAEQATPEQAVKISLLEMRYLAIKGDYQGAMDRFHWLQQQSPSPEYRLRAYDLAVQINEALREHIAAFTYLNKAQKLLPWTDNPKAKYRILSSAAPLILSAGDIEKAMEVAMQALYWAEQGGDQRDLCTAYSVLGAAQLEKRLLEEAWDSYQKSREYAEKTGLVLFQGVATQALGDIEKARGNYPAAIELYQSARPMLQKADYLLGLDDTELGLIESFHASGDSVSTVHLLDSVRSRLESSKDPNILKRLSLLMSQLEEGRGNISSALEWHKKYVTAYEAHIAHDETVAVAYQKVEFDTEAKEQRISLLEEKNKRLRAEEEVARQRGIIIFIGLGGALIISLLLGLLLIRSLRERREFRRLSRLDPLTGLNNHKTTYELAQDAFLNCQVRKLPFTVVIGDIDYFKRVNDNHGHAAGDEVLKALALHMQDQFTGEAIVGRTGGEEFSFFFSGLDEEEVSNLVEAFQQTLQPVTLYDKLIIVTMSFGLAAMEPEHKLMDTMIRNADSALYEAKRNGRNQLVRHRESDAAGWDSVQSASH